MATGVGTGMADVKRVARARRRSGDAKDAFVSLEFWKASSRSLHHLFLEPTKADRGFEAKNRENWAIMAFFGWSVVVKQYLGMV